VRANNIFNSRSDALREEKKKETRKKKLKVKNKNKIKILEVENF
jgi:hypothetical protein